MRSAIKTLAAFALAAVSPCLTFAQYTRTDLVTNSGAGGTVHDPHLVNAWGLVSTGTSPFWVSDNATGLSTLYAISNTNGVSGATIPVGDPGPPVTEGMLTTRPRGVATTPLVLLIE